MNSTGIWLVIALLYLTFLSGRSEKTKRVKKIAGSPEDRNSASTQVRPPPERSRPDPEGGIPPGFLSPSVKEYLELGKSVPGRPGADYPVLGEVPYTSFYCDNQRWPGFFADVETRCQAWHYCDIDGRQATFLCPNGTQFSQAVSVCDWWFNVRCDSSFQLYSTNGKLYHKRQPDRDRSHRKITKSLLNNIFV